MLGIIQLAINLLGFKNSCTICKTRKINTKLIRLKELKSKKIKSSRMNTLAFEDLRSYDLNYPSSANRVRRRASCTVVFR